MRELSACDRVLVGLDGLLRAATRSGLRQNRPYPAADVADEAAFSPAERRHAAGLMRVNHAGEVCAQALYLGQALLARQPATRTALERAAAEEGDHLLWCRTRLDELHARPSRLDPGWFVGALAIGMSAAALSDRVSLGFVEETERQVVRHLEGHLAALPGNDRRSRAVVRAMRDDEARHADAARAGGAMRLPWLARVAMAGHARVMTKLAYWI
ncbi:MAG: 2-polyprenyl-3-methyl-6-methoxy-1,4-benzoquinone monooxygenase [Gammaproteobacteria bacterium]